MKPDKEAESVKNLINQCIIIREINSAQLQELSLIPDGSCGVGYSNVKTIERLSSKSLILIK